ncbi:bifunctional UDP-N-acetylmuramoylalanyl-D-glutamate--2,6-diaminopimelate ligase/UDP-N-acetylmuramoyl-tripeptide:D-alanyl-D-alanine ligase [Candidatus Kinetoplastibacterium blastocrithidii TCC012E]|uniref:Multifunctional fusion protein n=1 Tax=Candidatus Kinetoplastidibacterium blastocrithidiae TCC012E TaxID=1208922 RepID=M1LC19_9PROT|nr:UDP-N-acetylmuramoyl-L-alanyl-D-glutamate--2,6-diaminopimelate ligase [Candidatus Kinetoplastibacterium blastocrithidii]AFZ83879.1 UDP-N-acetylmuramoylalanyl-D-glutamate--2,6-diaminopimelate ligase [Candidatus Kinetoplastibacterium blastocrithidii (ex Strigomonas culicis)]AGF49998.1 bifunctional UDP-N-acetylmuramoylalanyl-D-glutamate--2,6-diaminopimelate ligase/UDP-N-acetylmuramoyl-tripeptide:D-alanyl-D-alanine ligase [Candidatus Kinetoplastibacterium blastocrithidii TCC012E]
MSEFSYRSDHTYDISFLVSWLKERVSENSRLCSDSRCISPGDVFIAYSGYNTSGYFYIDEAIANGASAVLIDFTREMELSRLDELNILAVSNLSKMLGALAKQWYESPSDKITIIAVTGTNGKTSCVQWISQSLNNYGILCGTIGTLGALVHGNQLLYKGLTTPDLLSLHWIIFRMYSLGVEAIAMEASSIGLEEGRLHGLNIKIVALTNLTSDHLDYHKDIYRYERAKELLFDFLGVEKFVINLDDSFGKRLSRKLPVAKSLLFSANPSNQFANVRAIDIRSNASGQSFLFKFYDYSININVNVLGLYNISNILLVASVMIAFKVPIHIIPSIVESLSVVPGRLQRVIPISIGECGYPNPTVLVDFAHTADALYNVLNTLNNIARNSNGNLISLLGCGGNRDISKRSEMTKIAIRYSDAVFITSDNPRRENPEDIIQSMLVGIHDKSSLYVESNRALAILLSIYSARDNDIVLLAGKGHECYQEYSNKKVFFDDYQWARLAMLLPFIKGISINTRSLKEGELFIAIVGNKFDAHNYLKEAKNSGSCAAVVSRRIEGIDLPQILVDNTKDALTHIGSAYRKKYKLPVIAVVGSNGKTTTKEMIAKIFIDSYEKKNCLITDGNLNNSIGVPLTLSRLRENHKVAVLELGMNHNGEIADLSSIVEPTIVVITNAQREHQEFLYNVDNVAIENGSAIKFLPSDGIAIYPGDDKYSALWSSLTGGRDSITFGFSKECDIYARDINCEYNHINCNLVFDNQSYQFYLPITGKHNLRNALASISVSVAMGLKLSDVIKSLKYFESVCGRMKFYALNDNVLLIDDTYNSNPDSALAAIDVLKIQKGVRILVFGDMSETGSRAIDLHKEVGFYAMSQGIDILITIGENSMHAAVAFGSNAIAFSSIDIDDIVSLLCKYKKASILVKGSRSMSMERIVRSFSKTILEE